MKSLKDFNYLLSLDRRYTKTESEIFRYKALCAFCNASYSRLKRTEAPRRILKFKSLQNAPESFYHIDLKR